jgi:hypothetical protein
MPFHVVAHVVALAVAHVVVLASAVIFSFYGVILSEAKDPCKAQFCSIVPRHFGHLGWVAVGGQVAHSSPAVGLEWGF